MLKLTAKQLNASFQVFRQITEIKPPPGQQKLFYNLSRTWRELQHEADEIGKRERDIYQAFDAKTIKLPNGVESLQIDLEGMDAEQRADFDAKVADVLAIEIEIWGHPLTLDQMAAGNINLSIAEMSALDWLIVEDEEAPAPEKTKTKKAKA